MGYCACQERNNHFSDIESACATQVYFIMGFSDDGNDFLKQFEVATPVSRRTVEPVRIKTPVSRRAPPSPSSFELQKPILRRRVEPISVTNISAPPSTSSPQRKRRRTQQKRIKPTEPNPRMTHTNGGFVQAEGTESDNVINAIQDTTAVVPTPTPSIHDARKELRRLFNQVYNKWSRHKTVTEKEMSSLTSMHVSEEDFVKLTWNRNLAKYITLINYHLRFDQLPSSPHGQIISYMVFHLSQVFQSSSPANVLFGASDNGAASSFY